MTAVDQSRQQRPQDWSIRLQAGTCMRQHSMRFRSTTKVLAKRRADLCIAQTEQSTAESRALQSRDPQKLIVQQLSLARFAAVQNLKPLKIGNRLHPCLHICCGHVTVSRPNPKGMQGHVHDEIGGSTEVQANPWAKVLWNLIGHVEIQPHQTR